jgi:16S rRNA processing protein RimM
MEIFTDFPERLQPGIILYLGSESKQLHLAKRRQHQDGLLLTFEGYSTPEEVSQFRNQVVFLKAGDLPLLADGEYYHHQLISLHVITDNGKSIGFVAEILETGASDVLVIRSETGQDVLVPMVDAFVQRIDLARGEITVHLIPGMLPEEA